LTPPTDRPTNRPGTLGRPDHRRRACGWVGWFNPPARPSAMVDPGYAVKRTEVQCRWRV